MGNEIRKDIIRISRKMYAKGMINALEGNVSVRDGDKVYITPTSICKEDLTEEMITAVNMAGEVIEGDYPPTSEMKLHLECYRLRPDITSVVHNHSPYATAYALADRDIVSRAYPEMMIAFDKVPCIAYGMPSTDAVHAEVHKYIDKTDVFLISRHGVVSVGCDIKDAYFKIEAIEAIAKTLTLAHLIGGEAPLPDEEIDKLYQERKRVFGRDKM